ncbi:uncharacterized protein NdufV3 [Macrobrachium rosenbergii]|uniref:uncharacterized protein NdufV3 n=1 Tax=Macrobrachium rosenbergii TaxID=79674 RepID=UPI0034D59255
MSRLPQIIRLLRPIRVEAALLSPRSRGFCEKVTETTAAPETAEAASQTEEPAPEPVAAAPEPVAAQAFVYDSPATPADPGHAVGPGASKAGDYPNTEYYTYNKMSYFDLEVEMGADRIPQPSADNGRL